MGDKNWAWTNYLSQRALIQADNVRMQLSRTMERFDIDFISVSDQTKLYENVRKALVCGFFMQVAHKEEKSYVTVKDNQTVSLHPSCGLDSQPEWVMFNEFVLTTRPYIRTVTIVKPEWCVLDFKFLYLCSDVFRLLKDAANYYDLENWKDSDARRALMRVQDKRLGKLPGGEPPKKKKKRA